MSARPVILSLTGFRFVAAWLVVIGHTDAYIAPLLSRSVEYGLRVGTNVGMMLFFVLSGFVIHYNYGASINTFNASALRSFFVARFARLYPLYLFAFLIDIAAKGGSSHGVFWSVLPRYLTLTQNWTEGSYEGTFLTDLYVGAAWSLSAEVFLYLFYLLVAYPLHNLATWRATSIAIAAVVAIATVFFGGYAFGFWFSGLPDQQWWLDLSPYCRIPEFLLGALTGNLYLQLGHSGKIEDRSVHWIGIAGGVWIILVFALSYRFIYVQASWCFAPGLAALLFYCARWRNPLSQLVEHPMAVKLGDASYSIYLLHPLILYPVFAGSVFSIGNALFRLSVAWPLIAFLALGTYTNFEWPARRFLRDKLAPHTAGANTVRN